jgi:hypothetical protein
MTAIATACRSRPGQSNSVALSSKRKRKETIVPDAELSMSDAELLRAFERQGHDALAATYHAFFAPVTAMAIAPLLAAVSLRPGTHLLDVATGPGALAAAAAKPRRASRWRRFIAKDDRIGAAAPSRHRFS